MVYQLCQLSLPLKINVCAQYSSPVRAVHHRPKLLEGEEQWSLVTQILLQVRVVNAVEPCLLLLAFAHIDPELCTMYDVCHGKVGINSRPIL